MSQSPTVRDPRAVTSRISVEGEARRLRLTIRPFAAEEPIDITDAVTRAIAHEIWAHVGGNGTLNWIEAEHLVGSLLRQAQARSEEAPASRDAQPSAAGRGQPEESLARSITEALQEIAGTIGAATTGESEKSRATSRPRRREAIPA